MYPAERRQQILKLIEQDSHVTVADLACHFRVSRASIRRDLNELHSAGMLRRTYGGALRPAETGYEPPFNERKASHSEEKARIGRAAAQLVRPGETVFIDGGTTTEYMVAYLGEIPRLTVVTSGLNTINRLAGYDSITRIVIGGTLHQRSMTFVGVLAHDTMHAYNIHFDQAFIAATGVSAAGGVTNAGFEEIPMKRQAIETSRQTTLLADSSKVGPITAGLIAPAAKIHRLITGHEAPQDEVENLRRLGIVVDLV